MVELKTQELTRLEREYQILVRLQVEESKLEKASFNCLQKCEDFLSLFKLN